MIADRSPTVRLVALALSMGLATVSPALAQNAAVTVPPADGHEIVLYRDGPAEVTELRPIALPEAAGQLVATGLPRTAANDSLSAALVPAESDRVITADAVTLQAAEADAGGLLHRLVGREITWLVPAGDGAERAIRGVLRAAGPGNPVVERDGGLEVLPDGRLRLESIPADLALDRAASVAIAAPAGSSTLFLRYAAGGLAWDARYDLTVAGDGREVTLAGDYLIVNAGAADFANARLRLVAGDVPRVGDPRPVRAEAVQSMMARSAPMADAGGAPKAASVGERQIFAVSRPVTLAGNSTVRRPLFAPVTLPAERRYILEGQGEAWIGRGPDASERQRPRVELGFENSSAGPLGRPLPAGKVSVRAANAGGGAGGTPLPTLLLAEARLDATAVGERVTLDLGMAFDVGARRRLAAFEWLGAPDERTNRRPYRARHEIVLRNAKKSPVSVDVVERFSTDWRVEDSSHPAERVDARTARFAVTVPAGGETVFTYTVRAGG